MVHLFVALLISSLSSIAWAGTIVRFDFAHVGTIISGMRIHGSGFCHNGGLLLESSHSEDVYCVSGHVNWLGRDLYWKHSTTVRDNEICRVKSASDGTANMLEFNCWEKYMKSR